MTFPVPVQPQAQSQGCGQPGDAPPPAGACCPALLTLITLMPSSPVPRRKAAQLGWVHPDSDALRDECFLWPLQARQFRQIQQEINQRI